MTARKTIEEIKESVESFGYILLDAYIKNGKTRVFIEDSYGYKYDVVLMNLIGKSRSGNLNFVDVSNPHSPYNISIWLKLNNKSFILCENQEYKDAKTHMKFHCYICKEEFKSCWSDIYSNRGCGVCRGLQVGKYNNLEYLFPDLAKEWHPNNKKKPSEVTVGSGKKAWWICSKCNYEWESIIGNRTKGINCPKCNSSKGESKVSKFLFENNIKHITGYKFDDCKDKRKLPFDFFIPDFNLCIEYDGILHHEDKFNNPKEFRLVQKRDAIKTKFCEDNNINLLRIPYWDFENIEQILRETLSL